jgi:hypothetical protein
VADAAVEAEDVVREAAAEVLGDLAGALTAVPALLTEAAIGVASGAATVAAPGAVTGAASVVGQAKAQARGCDRVRAAVVPKAVLDCVLERVQVPLAQAVRTAVLACARVQAPVV